uniref:Uncharacterized protein n=1 Tax=Arundo donax TaxID=35708 RepID=A0A0A9BS02_ARUDO
MGHSAATYKPVHRGASETNNTVMDSSLRTPNNSR